MSVSLEPILVNGYFVTLHSPSANLFKTVKVDFSNLSGEELYRMIEELEEIKSEINQEYRRREVETVSESDIRAEFRRARARRQRIVNFSPYPNRFGNIVNSVRTRLYNALNQYAMVISNIEVGAFRRNVYLLPRDSADDFLRVVDSLNQELDELDEMLKEYHEKGYMDKIINILRKYNVNFRYYKVTLRRIYVNMLPIILDPDIIKPYVSPRVRREIEEMERKMIIEAVKNTEKKVVAMVNQYMSMIKAKKFNPKEAAKQLAELRDKINSLGIVSVDSIINPLIDLCNNPDKLEKEAMKMISGKVKALLESL
ncbi:MAG TPA: hypothetical protein ENF47_02955 [Thermoprotei archaeon]|nr:hypothetical protein [Thermoprotei archaeon]